MNKNFLSFCLSICMLLMFSCSDPCKDVDCNNGSCDDGICECLEGYSGEFCDTEDRAKFYGTYEGEFMCDDSSFDLSMLGFADITVVIGPGETITEIDISAPSFPIDILGSGTIAGDSFTLETTESELDLSDIPDIPFPSITITTTGDGELLSETQIELNINIIVPLLGTFPCTVILDKI